jgi:hypothetical protein
MSSPDRADLNRRAGEQPASDLGPDVAMEMQALFLLRLRQLLDKRYGAGVAKFSADQRLLLDRGIYSTFCDCLELNLSTQARSLLKEVRES